MATADVSTGKSSSSDNVTPFRRANASKGNLNRYGMPLDGQFRTADTDRPNSAATSDGPPNRASISAVSPMSAIISRCGTFGNPEMRRDANPQNSKDSVTFVRPGVTLRDVGQAKKKYADFGRRLRIAREALFDGDAKQFAISLGLKPQSYRNYERGDRYPDEEVTRLLALRGISLQWLFLEEKPMIDAIRAQASSEIRKIG